MLLCFVLLLLLSLPCLLLPLPIPAPRQPTQVVDPSPSVSKSTAKPAAWWGAEEDRNFLLGMYLNGSVDFSLLATDARLCFAKQLGTTKTVSLEEKKPAKKKSKDAKESKDTKDVKETTETATVTAAEVPAPAAKTVDVVCEWPEEKLLKARYFVVEG